MNIEAILIVIVSLFLFVVCLIVFRNTILDPSVVGTPWPLLWYKEILLVILPCCVVSVVGIDFFIDRRTIFLADSSDVLPVNIIVLVSMYLYVVSLAFSLKFLPLKRDKYRCTINCGSASALKDFGFSVAILSLSLLALSILFFGYKHCLLESLIAGRPWLETRLHNRYFSSFPSQLSAFIVFSGFVVAISGGYLYGYKKLSSIVLLLVSLLLVSSRGDKAPILYAFLLFGLAQFYVRFYSYEGRRGSSGVMIAIRVVLLVVFLILMMYVIYRLRVPGVSFSDYLMYLFCRLGFGQMSGVYETYALAKRNAIPPYPYYLHMFPFWRHFSIFANYHKVLMMMSEGVGYSEMGVKNTLFIAEAYAIGGLPFLIVSPFLMGVVSVVSLYVIYRCMRLLFGGVVSSAYLLPVYFMSVKLTGGIASFLLMKGVLLVCIYLGFIWFSFFFFRLLRKMLLTSASSCS